MCRVRALLLLVFSELCKAGGSGSGPRLTLEPPAQLWQGAGGAGGVRGAGAGCAARGDPPPQLTWLHADGTPLPQDTHRSVLPNGTLLFPLAPDSSTGAARLAGTFRCRATNAHGTVLSRDMKVQHVQWEEWSAIMSGGEVLPSVGGPALLSCAAPGPVRARGNVQAWYRDDTLLPIDDQLGGVMLVSGGWQLVLWALTPADSGASFACAVLDPVTGERRRSPPYTLEVAPLGPPGPPRALLGGAWETTVWRGEDAVIPCLVYANPPATITWYRESAGGALHELSASARWSFGAGARGVRLRRADARDAGALACRARNVHGRLTVRVQLHVRDALSVTLHPHTQVVDSGGTALLNCSWAGWPPPRVLWLHDGAPLASPLAAPRVTVTPQGDQLIIHNVQRSDKGMYQCVVRNEMDSAQATSELRLGDTTPELVYTFIEQALRPGQLVALRCAAVGAPPPTFGWMLDQQPLNTMARGHRYSVEQFTSSQGEVVSFLNISSVRAEDGGLYSCRAANSRGEATHTARLNIYGPPYVRSIAPVRAVAGRELVLYCPYSGYPISSVRWERGGEPLEWGGGGMDGALRIARVAGEHAGAYACAVSGPHGLSARTELQLVVSNPPEIEPFSFSANVVAGRRAQVGCSVTAGDMPVHFTWLKDGAPIPKDLQVEERGADFFSNLVFKEVSARHSGRYTCVAANSAARVNHTAELVVKVPPQWIHEPRDTSVLAGEPLMLHCDVTGSPPPTITWLRQRGQSSSDLVVVVEDGRVQLAANGSLLLTAARPHDEGRYTCRADNGVPPPLQHNVFVHVNEPARFEQPSANVSARRGAPCTLTCEARGDAPVAVSWAHDDQPLDLNTYRVSISEAKTESGLRSTLSISRTERADSGVYRCQAVNAYGHSDHYIYLSVQERPEPPLSLSVVGLWSRGVRLAWAAGYDGRAPLAGFALQAAPLTAPLPASHAVQWDHVPVLNVSLHDTQHPHVTLTRKGSGHFEAALSNLRPACAYIVRAAAYNSIARSEYSEPIVLKTREEAPSEPPSAVAVTAGGPGELLVSWRPPERAAWHGELLGYMLTCREIGPDDTANNTRTLTVNGWSTTELSLSSLRKFTRYEVRVRAFNGVAAGPASAPVTATTLEGVPEWPPQRVSCTTLSSSSIKVSWAPPPAGRQGGIIQGYKVIYTPLTTDHDDVGEVNRVTTTDTYLHTLRKYTNYSIQVLSFTNAGDGKRSPAIYCMTEEDVPSAPQKIKALAFSSDSVLVSWLPPVNPNGVISHYTVYYREAGRLGKHLSFTVPVAPPAETELMFTVRSLRESQLYEFWVAATSASGEGDPTPVVGQGPGSRIPARIASFGRVVAVPRGGATLLACVAVGTPPPRSRWTHRRQPVTHHPYYQVTHRGHLHIREVNEQSSGNFTCTASNTLGEDAVVWRVRALVPPLPPALRLQYATASSLTLHWLPTSGSTEPLLGYLLHYNQMTETTWSSVELSPDTSTFTLDMLKCGTTYHAQIQAKNKVSIGPPSETLTASTRGGRPKPPKPEEHMLANATAIKVNLYAWRDGGCPILGFRISYRRAGTEHWTQFGDGTSAGSLEIGDLLPGTWYELTVIADSDAGPQQENIMVDTHTLSGGRIGPLASPAPAAGVARPLPLRAALVWGGCSMLALLCVALALCALRRRHQLACGCNSKLSDTNEPEREKLRDNHKLYSSSSINGNDKSNDDSSAELYEISPYATFGVPGCGVGGAGVGAVGAHALSFRTLARREDDAAPPHRRRRRACDHYTYEESSLSQCSTVEARHRMRAAGAHSARSAHSGGAHAPHARGWRERERSDSDDNSDSAANTTTKGSGSPGGSVYGSGRRAPSACSGGLTKEGLLVSSCVTPVDISSLIDKYQQRKEQERRECTIHV